MLRGESLIASTGLVLAVILLLSMAATAYWTMRVQRNTQEAAQAAEIQSLGALLSETAALMLSVEELSSVRRMITDVGRTYRLKECRIVLPDGQIVADADPSRITTPSLPLTWTGGRADGAIDESTDEEARWSYAFSIRGRGNARLDLVASAPHTFDHYWHAQAGVAVIGGAALLLLLLIYRRIRTRVVAMGIIREALLAIDKGEKNPYILALHDEFGPEARAWNQLLSDRERLEKQSLANRVEEAMSSRQSVGRQLQSLCDAMRHAVILVDRSLCVTYANGAAAVYLGAGPDEITGRKLRDLVPAREVLDAVRAAIANPVRPWVSVEVGEQILDTSSILRFSVRPLRREDASAAMITVEDITQQRVADEARNAFITQVTHELRAPLTNIRLSAETAIEDGEEDPQARAKCLNVINQEAKRLERVVSDMLSVSEIEAGSLNLNKDDVRLDVLFSELEADYAEQAQARGVALELNLPPKIPVITGDRDKIALAVHNLVNNAIKYTPEGGQVTVNVEVENGDVIIGVTDSGIGIAESDVERVFEKFYRARDERLADITGSGLGLALAREVVRLHGGDIRVESEIDKGSTFTLTLPVTATAA
jgi:PAS domain S-box-containing protein